MHTTALAEALTLRVRFALNIYDLLLRIGVLFLAPLARFHRGVRRLNLNARLTLPQRTRQVQSTVWLHAASLGECKLLLTFLSVLRTRNPHRHYLLTATTESGLACLNRFPAEDIVGCALLPVDIRALMEKLCTRFGVSRVWIMETEIWPGMLTTCLERSIPVGMVNARLEERSWHRYRRFGWVLRELLASLSPVLVQSETYGNRFKALGVPDTAIRVTGNIKSFVTVTPADPDRRISIRSDLGITPDETVITAGCIHPGEGAVVESVLEAFTKNGVSCRVIVVPRHREAVRALCEEIGEAACVVTTLAVEHAWRICIVDAYGVLDELYAVADGAFVGGTFKEKVGGHNMWDGARFGIPVVFGPHVFSQQESADRLLAAGVASSIDSPQACGPELYSLVVGEKRERFSRNMAALSHQLHCAQQNLENLIGKE